MTTSNTVRWGLAGYGDLSRKRLVKALNESGSRLEVVWGRQAAKVRSFAEELGIPRATDDINTLMQDVDAIYVATPVISHVPIVELALDRNLRVIVEKPLSPLVHPTDHLVQIATQKHIQIAVAYYRRLMPAAQYVKYLLSSRSLGQLLRVTVEFGSLFNPSPNDPKRWRCNPAVAGSGVMADVGSHRLDLLCWFLGKPKILKACLKDPFPEGGERVAQLELLWSDSLHAVCYFSWNDPIQDFMCFDFEYGQLIWSPLDSGQLCFRGEEETWEKHLPPMANPHVAFVFAFCQDLPTCSLREAVLVDRIIEAAVQSHGTGGSWISLS